VRCGARCAGAVRGCAGAVHGCAGAVHGCAGAVHGRLPWASGKRAEGGARRIRQSPGLGHVSTAFWVGQWFVASRPSVATWRRRCVSPSSWRVWRRALRPTRVQPLRGADPRFHAAIGRRCRGTGRTRCAADTGRLPRCFPWPTGPRGATGRTVLDRPTVWVFQSGQKPPVAAPGPIDNNEILESSGSGHGSLEVHGACRANFRGNRPARRSELAILASKPAARFRRNFATTRSGPAAPPHPCTAPVHPAYPCTAPHLSHPTHPSHPCTTATRTTWPS
jgi:hypothetical protein